jgi:hypothetical protein
MAFSFTLTAECAELHPQASVGSLAPSLKIIHERKIIPPRQYQNQRSESEREKEDINGNIIYIQNELRLIIFLHQSPPEKFSLAARFRHQLVYALLSCCLLLPYIKQCVDRIERGGRASGIDMQKLKKKE